MKNKKPALSEYTLESIEQDKKRARIIKDTKKDLETNPGYKEFFSRYREDSVKSFIKYYASDKANYLIEGEYFLNEKDNIDSDIKKQASNCLWEIQQKKLFNLQCQWRAEQLKIKEIESVQDFMYLHRAIKKCTFVSPVTEEEVQLYIKYLSTDTDDHYDHWNYHGWNDYTDYKRYIERNDPDRINPLSQWYKFYDAHKGTDTLLDLPDVRDEKEEFYSKIWFEKEHKKKMAALKAKQSEEDKRPYLSSRGEDLENFIRRFEEKAVIKYHEAKKKTLKIKTGVI